MRQTLIAAGLWGLLGAAGAADHAALLVYQIDEHGSERFISRMLITDAWVRLDEGDDNGAFTLLDRAARRLYNVSPSDQSVLELPAGIDPGPAPESLRLSSRVTEQPEAPEVNGVRPQRLELLAEGEVCHDLQVAPGLMSTALTGVVDFYAALARIDAAMIQNLPPETQQPCDLAYAVYAPEAPYSRGLPIAEQGGGKSRVLVDFSPNASTEDRLFQIPEEYKRVALPGAK